LYGRAIWAKLRNMRLNFDVITYEAEVFSQTLDQTVTHIHSEAFGGLVSAFEKQSERVEAWLEEDTGTSKGQFEDHIRKEWMVQVRALTTMTFALMATQLLSFIKTTNRTFLARYFQSRGTRYGKSKDGEFSRLAAEYRECYGIELDDLPGVETCREIVLARNACIHGQCAPSDDYLQQTAGRFLGDDGLLFLNRETLGIATTGIKTFVEALARATRKRIDQVKADRS
jgi:hypothetical protein